jgi:hypothetical protein
LRPDNPDAVQRGTQTLRERVDAAIDRMGERAEGDAPANPLPTEGGERSLDGTSSQVPGE